MVARKGEDYGGKEGGELREGVTLVLLTSRGMVAGV